jgi:ribosomal protein L37AE/L43A
MLCCPVAKTLLSTPSVLTRRSHSALEVSRMGFRVKFANVSSFAHKGFATHLDFGSRASSPVLPRCPHSIYLATSAERTTGSAHYCGACNPNQHYGALGGDTRKMSFALRYQSTPRRERLTANKSERNSNACPQCGSDYRYALENSPLVECSECGTHWRPIRRGDSVHSKDVAA